MSSLLEKYKNGESIGYENYEKETLNNLKFQLDAIEDVVLEKCELKNVSFRDLYMGKVTFKNCVLTNCYFMNVNASHVIFEDCKLTDVVFDEGKISHFKMIDSLVQFCTFSKEIIVDSQFVSRFISCTFEGVSLTSCDFQTSYFSELRIQALNCDGVKLDKAKLDTIIGDIMSLKGATLSMTQALDIVMGIGIEIAELS
ncbi:MAG: pentapeptide repeat-containing protein [Bacilli bacterium]|nr:pentapeptide repeat-containing protein [Bacilli bacterium]